MSRSFGSQSMVAPLRRVIESARGGVPVSGRDRRSVESFAYTRPLIWTLHPSPSGVRLIVE